ncbi:MAG TPA: NUDIX hydrolase [Pseudonocardiaceae bacterium]|jgi:8-oxo-dGTP diphosphatase|nr:NUDIX hydrolase [Pseudonocardiaceae bacterium]
MAGPAESDRVTVRAAGTVLWRRPTSGRVEIAVVHRPSRDDWSLPKGKLERGETLATCAVRETHEETGYLPVLGRPLGDVRYRVAEPVPGLKSVTYFAGRADGGPFRPNREVDELRWLRPAAALELLAYATDREVVGRFTALPADTRTVLLVRHAKAGKRSTWTGPDEQRPLSPLGEHQAAALRMLLPLFGPERVHAADLLRCVETVRGVADELGEPVAIEPMLTETAHTADPGATVRRLIAVARAEGTPVICSQGGVIPDVIGRLAERAGLNLGHIRAKKGSVWVLSFSTTKPLRLLAAYYLPTALPEPDVTGPERTASP